MATIGGLTSTTSSSIRGYGGLASGLDRDTLIEGMTSGTTSKITKQQQEQQKLEWKQEAIQNISSQMIEFANKYTSSWSSNTNLFSSVFWGRNNITTTGENSKYVSVSGSGTSAEGVTIMGVKQLAQKAKWSSKGNVSSQTLSTKAVDITSTFPVQQLVGKDITFKIGNGSSANTYTLTLKNEETINGKKVTYDYSTPEKAAESINKQMMNVETSLGKLSEVVNVSLTPPADDATNPGGATSKFVFTDTKSGGNNFEITGGSALEYLGFGKDFTHNFSSGKTVTADANAANNLIDQVSFARLLDGKSLTFSYNGETAEIKMPGRAELESIIGDLTKQTPEQIKETTEKVFTKIQESMQEQLNDAFGKGRIQVDLNKTKDGLNFTTMNPKTGAADTTSTFTLVSGNADVKYVLGLQDGMSNRVNMSEKLKNSGLTFDQTETVQDDKGNNITKKFTTFKINDETIKVYEDDTMNSLIDRINNSKADVKVTYQEAADKFTFTSTEDGASGKIEIKSDAVTEKLFGIKTNVEESGQDAIVAVKYAGSDDEVELIRGSNSFTVDGLTINVKGKFGYKEELDADGNVTKSELIKNDPSSVVEIDAQVDADSIVDAVKSMVEEYNSLIELVNKELTTKPDKDYSPLTSEQKAELSESEIELYEKKAKEGMLYSDSDIRGLSSDLRFIIDGGIAQELANMGISTSSTYSDNGKLVFDESKFRAALASDPERVQELFAGSSVENTNKNGFSKGIATNLKSVMDKYVNTMGAMESKGILIRKAGSASSPMSLTENTIYKQLAEIKKKITSLQTQLETERDRYIKQFTSLETLISQMNSQSSWLSGMFG